MIELSLDFPTRFFQEEYRSGYLVSYKMKEIWAVELDLLYKFQKVCQKYNLKYFAESGTLLGAVRHGGFIPWDDDIDVVMLRSDYSKLCEIAEKEFGFPYFFQTESTDPGSMRTHAQLRNSKTTGILESENGEKYCFNQGIFIDIFSMDVVPPVGEQAVFFDKLDYLRNKSREFANKYQRRGIYIEENPYFQELEILSQRYNKLDMPKIGTLAYSGRRRDMMRKKVDYLDSIEWKFEFLTITVPNGYKRILSEQYGNWKEFVIGKTAHGGILFDTEKSYKEYVEER